MIEILVSVITIGNWWVGKDKCVASLSCDTLVRVYGGSFAKIHNVDKRMCSSVWSFENVPE